MNCSFDTCRCGCSNTIEHRSKKRSDKFAILSYLRPIDFKYLRIPTPKPISKEPFVIVNGNLTTVNNKNRLSVNQGIPFLRDLPLKPVDKRIAKLLPLLLKRGDFLLNLHIAPNQPSGAKRHFGHTHNGIAVRVIAR